MCVCVDGSVLDDTMTVHTVSIFWTRMVSGVLYIQAGFLLTGCVNASFSWGIHDHDW